MSNIIIIKNANCWGKKFPKVRYTICNQMWTYVWITTNSMIIFFMYQIIFLGDISQDDSLLKSTLGFDLSLNANDKINLENICIANIENEPLHSQQCVTPAWYRCAAWYSSSWSCICRFKQNCWSNTFIYNRLYQEWKNMATFVLSKVWWLFWLYIKLFWMLRICWRDIN